MKQNLLDIFKVFSGHFQRCTSVWKYLPQHLDSDHLSVKILVNCLLQQVLLGTIFSLTLSHWAPPLTAVKQQLSSVRPLVLSAVWTPARGGDTWSTFSILLFTSLHVTIYFGSPVTTSPTLVTTHQFTNFRSTLTKSQLLTLPSQTLGH